MSTESDQYHYRKNGYVLMPMPTGANRQAHLQTLTQTGLVILKFAAFRVIYFRYYEPPRSGNGYADQMKIHEMVWPEERIDHIARHAVSPEEVEDVCFGGSLVQRAKAQGSNPIYYVLGETRSGRLLFCVVIRFPEGRGYPVTARPMTDGERRKYLQWRSR